MKTVITTGRVDQQEQEVRSLTAPGSIELNENVLVLVLGNFIEVLSDEDLDRGLVPILRNILRQKVLLQFAVQESLDKVLDVLSGDGIVFRLVLGHVLLQLDQPHAGQLVLLHAKELQDSLVILLVGVDGDEQDLALVFLSEGSGNVNLGFVVVGLLREEEEQVVLDFAAEDLLGGLVVELNKERQGIGGNKLGDGFNIVQVLGQVIAALIEGLKQDNGIT